MARGEKGSLPPRTFELALFIELRLLLLSEGGAGQKRELGGRSTTQGVTRFRREVPSLPLSTLCRWAGGGVCIERAINIAGQKNAAAPLELPGAHRNNMCAGREEGRVRKKN